MTFRSWMALATAGVVALWAARRLRAAGRTPSPVRSSAPRRREVAGSPLPRKGALETFEHCLVRIDELRRLRANS